MGNAATINNQGLNDSTSSARSQPQMQSPNPHSHTRWTAETVATFIETICPDLAEYRTTIIKNNLDGDKLSNLTNERDIEVAFADIGICNDFHKKIISENLMHAIHQPYSYSFISEISHQLSQKGVTFKSKQKREFPVLGLKIAGLREFISICGGSNALNGLTVEDVNRKYMKPITFLRKQSYCEMMDIRDSRYTGEANALVSFSRQSVFLDLVEACDQHFSDFPNYYLWLDLFSVDQHNYPEPDINWLVTTLKLAIDRIHHSVLVLTSVDDDCAICRTSCLYEAYLALITGAKFEIAMSSGQRKKFMTTVENDDEIIDRLVSVDITNSVANSDTEKSTILQATEACTGSYHLNTILSAKLREFAYTIVFFVFSSCREPRQEACIQLALGKIRLSQRKFAESEARMKKALKTRTESLDGGVKHPDTLNVMECLADAYMKSSRFLEAEQLYADCSKLRVEVHGLRHIKVCSSMLGLARCCSLQGRCADAKKVCENCLSILLETLGESHPTTATVMFELAKIYDQQGNFIDAEEKYEKCHAIQERVFGPKHQDTLSTNLCVAGIFVKQSAFEEAEELYNKTSSIMKSALGPKHPRTITALLGLAGLYEQQEKYDESEALYLKCIDLRKEVLGERHPDTLSTYVTLAGIYALRGKYAEAESLYLQYNEADILEDTKTEAQLVLYSLGIIYYNQEKLDQAGPVLFKCLFLRKELFGEDGALTLDVMRDLADVYERQGRTQEANELRGKL